MDLIISITFIAFFGFFALKSLQRSSNIIYLWGVNILYDLLFRFRGKEVLVNFGEIGITFSLLTCFLMIVLILVKKINKLKRCWFLLPFSLFSFMAFISFVRGAITNPSEIAFDFTVYINLITASWYVILLFKNVDFKRYFRFFDFLAAFLVSYALIGFTTYYVLGINFGTYGDARPISAVSSVMYLVIYSVFRFYRDLNRPSPRMSVWTMICVLVIIVNGYNTTWVALFIGFLFIILFRSKTSSLLNLHFVTQVALILLSLSLVMIFFPKLSIIQSVITTSEKFTTMNEAGTFIDRVQLWQVFLNNMTPADNLIGKPFGMGNEVMSKYGIWSHSPHSTYVQTIYKTGYIGFAFFILSILSLIVVSLKNKKFTLVAVMCAVAAYGFTYTFPASCHCIFGILYYFNFIRPEGSVLNGGQVHSVISEHPVSSIYSHAIVGVRTARYKD